ncbi:MAG TPA: hypothetical protein DHV59_01580 [Oxalobacteraceae bacterium]|nr:hypothetical protein [Oxalobacteraceae bacterium]
MANPNYWYARHFKDYAEKTAHLSMVEHGAYTLLLDHYYQTGGKLMANAMALLRVCRCQTDDERIAVQSVLDQFFFLGDDGMYHNKRADKEMGVAANVSAARSQAGKVGAEKRWKNGKEMANAMANDMANAMANTKQTVWQNDAQPQPQPQQHIKNPPISPKGITQDQVEKPKSKRAKASETLQDFVDRCKAEGVKPIPLDDPIFDYIENVGLTEEMLVLGWFVFKSRYLGTDQKQKDWRAHYRNAVKSNWYKLWFIGNDGTVGLTTAGQQTQREMEAVMAKGGQA